MRVVEGWEVNNNNVPLLNSTYHIQMASLCARGIITPALAPMQRFSAKSIEGINSCWVPIYYTWVERNNCGQYALSMGVRTEWDLNPRPSDYKSRAQTTTPQCSHWSRWNKETDLLGKRSLSMMSRKSDRMSLSWTSSSTTWLTLSSNLYSTSKWVSGIKHSNLYNT